jgi:hypothetical protein
MAITFPRDAIFEFYLNDWIDATASVKQGTTVAMSGGLKDEAAKLAPTSCALTLYDPNGTWAPQNPLGPYHGLLGRNVPMRVALRTARDDFTRTVSNGWGTATSGETWATNTGPPGDYLVNGSAAVHSVSGTSTYRYNKLNGVSYKNCEVTVKVTVPTVNVTGGSIEPANILLRGNASNNYYMIRMIITTAEDVTLQLQKDSGTFGSPVTVPTISNANGTSYWVKAQIEGNTVRAKVWRPVGVGEAALQTEPLRWHMTYTDTTEYLTAAGYVGIRSGVASGNTNTSPVVFTYDNFTIRSMRFHGEVSRFSPDRDLSGNYKTVPIRASNILQRLQQQTSPVISAPKRYITKLTAGVPVAYWPLEGGKLTTRSNPAIGDGQAFINPYYLNLLGVDPTQFMGQGELAPWLPPGVAVWNLAIIQCEVPASATFSGAWTAECLYTCSGGRYDSDIADTFYVSDLVNQDWIAELHSFTNVITLYGPGGFGPFSSAAIPALFDGKVHHLRLTLSQSGGNCVFTAYVDGVSAVNGSVPYTFRAPKAVLMAGALSTTKRVFGHCVLYGAGGQPLAADSAYAMLGRVGEKAGRRIERLCGDAGIQFEYRGDLDLTTPMGPQPTDTLVKLLQECAQTDLGTLYEPRGIIGLGYRTLKSLTNQTATLALNYTSKQVAEPFVPIFDDAPTVNDIKVKQRYGDEYHTEKTTGPMNVNDPGTVAGAVGRADDSVDVNAQTVNKLQFIGGWLLHLGTNPEARFPTIAINLAATGVRAQSGLTESILDVGADDVITVDNTSALYVFDQVRQMARGYSEVFNTNAMHTISFNTAPASGYDTVRLDDTTYGRIDSATTTLNEDLTTTETAVDTVTSGAGGSWSATAVPYDVIVAGERWTVTAVSGATLTVTRSVNGVVKAHPNVLPTEVHLFRPIYLLP